MWRQSTLFPTCLKPSLFHGKISRQVGRTSKWDPEQQSFPSGEASLSLRTRGSLPPPKDTRVNTVTKRTQLQVAWSREVSLVIWAWAASPLARDTGAGGWNWQEGPTYRKQHVLGSLFVSVGSRLALPTQRYWEAGAGLGEPRAITALPHQEVSGSLAWLLSSLQAAPAGTLGSSVAPDTQSGPISEY